MKRSHRGLGVVALVALCVAAPVRAQEMELGMWTGTMNPPGGEGVPVTYRVDINDGALQIVMNNVQLGDMLFNEPRVSGGELTFWWEPGTRVDCVLMRKEDGSFEGTCSAGNGDGAITMVPPGR